MGGRRRKKITIRVRNSPVREGGEGEAHAGAGEKCEDQGAGERNQCVLTTTHLDPTPLSGQGDTQE